MRQPQPWFRNSKNAWYVERNGRQQMLGKHDGDTPPKRGKTGWNPPSEIREAYRKLMAEGPVLPPSETLFTAQLCDLFLDYAKAHTEPRTFKWYRSFLQYFCDHHGKLRAKDLKPIHVTRWLDAHPTWKAGRRAAVTSVKRAFHWADEQGLLCPNPLRGVKRPPTHSRARTLTPEERTQILTAITDLEFREFVQAMQETGCRPSEVARVTAADVNLELGVWVLHKHKTAKKTGKPRIVYLTPTVLGLSRKLMAKYPEGPLFRGPRSGKPFGMQGICSRFRRLREKLPHLKNAIAYAYRHSFASEALQKGVGIVQVAELLGHTDTSMVMRHYQHIAENVDHMRDAAAKAVT